MVLGLLLLFGGAAGLLAQNSAALAEVPTAEADQLYGANEWDRVSQGCGLGGCPTSCSYYQADDWWVWEDAYGVLFQGNCNQSPYGACGVYHNVDVAPWAGRTS
jgi:hypothetical protein